MKDHILDTIDRNAKVVFYPSSCRYSDEFQDAPYDVIILNSNSIRRRERRGKVYCLNYDNNEILGLFLAKGIRLSAIVIICDGCVEGGNYECCARDGFFGRLMPVVTDQFDYFCDHKQLPFDVPARFDEFETPSYMDPFIRNSDTLNDVRSFHVTTFSVVDRDFVLGRIRVRIIWDSIWRYYDQSSLVVVKKIESSKFAIPKYLAGLLPGKDLAERFEFVTQSSKTSIEHMLQKADDMKLPRLSLIPIAGGSYRRIAKEIQLWNRDYPKEIFFYHLNANDFQYLKSL